MVSEKWITDRFDVKELTKIGFFDKKRIKEVGYLEFRIKQFFGFKSIYEWDRIMDEQKPLKAKNIFSNN